MIRHRAQGMLFRKFSGLKIRLYNMFNSSDPYTLTKKFENLEEAIKYINDSPRNSVSHIKVMTERTGSQPTRRGAVKVLEDLSDLV